MNAAETLLLLEGVPSSDAPAMLLALVVAFGLGLVVSVAHRLSVPGRVVSPSLQASLALLPVVSAMVLAVIGDSLARAFSLVGALAIVRFRTRLRTTWDITFVFLALAAGIGCGTGKMAMAVMGVGVAVLAVCVLAAFPGTRHPAREPAVLRCDIAALETPTSALEAVLQRHCGSVSLSGTRSLRFGETLSLTYRVQLSSDDKLLEVVRELSAIEGVERVTALSGAHDEGDGDD